MSANAIVYNGTTNDFDFNGITVGPRQLRSIAEMLETQPVEYHYVRSFSGKRSRRKVGRFAWIGQVSVTANYIRGLLKFVEENGWFVDHIDVCGDHRFDPNIPTPGANWGQSTKLKETARELLKTADQLITLDPKSAQLLQDRAGVLQRESKRLRAGYRPRKVS